MKRHPFPPRGTLLAILALAFALRLAALGDPEVWWDEAWSVWLSRHDPLTIARLTASDAHPPLHYWFLSAWTRLLGEGEFAVRLSSVFFGVLTVALLYSFAAQTGTPRVGLIAALLLALARFHVWWSQEVKMYAPGIFLALLSFAVLLRALHLGQRRWWVVYILITLLGLSTLYLYTLAVLVQGLVVVAYTLMNPSLWRQRLLPWLIATLAAGILYSPWVLAYLRLGMPRQAEEPFEFELFLRLYATLLPLGISTELHRYQGLLLPLWALAGLGSLVALWRGSPKVRLGLGMALLGLLLSPGVVYLLSLMPQALYHPKMAARYMILFVPFFFLLAAYGVAALARAHRLLALGALAFFVLVQGYTLDDYFASRHRTDDLRALASFVLPRARVGDTIVVNPDKDWPVFAYYLPGDFFREQVPFLEQATPERAEFWLAPIQLQSGTVWLITTREAASTDPAAAVPRWLREHYPEVATRTYGQVRLTLFSEEQRPFSSIERLPGTLLRSDQEVAPGLTLVGYHALPTSLKTGDRLYVTAYWRLGEGVRGVPQMGVALLDASDTPVARSLRSPLVGDAPAALGTPVILQSQHRLSIGRHLPSGRYRLALLAEGADLAQPRQLPLQSLQVTQTRKAEPVPPPTFPAAATLGGQVQLVGWDLLPAPPQPGERLELTLHWRALEEMDVNYTVFVHLLDSNGKLIAQQDRQPLRDTFPTSAWSPGEIVLDPYDFALPPGTPTEGLTFRVGMYDPTISRRLPLTDEQGRETGENSVPLPLPSGGP